MLKNIVLILIASFLFSSCIKPVDGNENCTYDPCVFKAPDAEVQAIQTYLSNNGLQAEKHCSGLFYRIENPGTGKTPEVCDGIVINYRGSLTNGNVFDARTDPANPIGFNLGDLITGWINSIPLIKEGGRIHLYIPPTLGYGNRDITENGQVKIPGGSILIFEIDLRQVIK